MYLSIELELSTDPFARAALAAIVNQSVASNHRRRNVAALTCIWLWCVVCVSQRAVSFVSNLACHMELYISFSNSSSLAGIYHVRTYVHVCQRLIKTRQSAI